MARYFFTSAATFSTITTGITSPFSCLFTFSDDSSYFLQRSCFLDRLFLPLLHLQTHPPPSWTETATSRLRFPGKAQMCWAEQSPVLDTMLASYTHNGACLSPPQRDTVDSSLLRMVSCRAGHSLLCLWVGDFSSLLKSRYMTSITAHLCTRPILLPWKDIKLILCDLFLTNQTWL